MRAGEVLYNASLNKQNDRDFMAYSIFRAAVMMQLAGKKRDAEQLVERLERHFPDSEWVTEGKRLLENNK